MGSWQAFIAKFRLFADESHWAMSQRKNHLCWALDGEASKYTAMILEREPYITYSVLAEKLEKTLHQARIARSVADALHVCTSGSRRINRAMG